MAFTLATSARDAACDAIVDLIDAGAGAGTMEIRSGTQPANPGTPATGVVLANFTFGDPAFGDSSSGTATANAIAPVTIANTGTAGWFRMYDSNANPVGDGTCGQGTGDISWDNASFVQNGTATISALTVTVPEA